MFSFQKFLSVGFFVHWMYCNSISHCLARSFQLLFGFCCVWKWVISQTTTSTSFWSSDCCSLWFFLMLAFAPVYCEIRGLSFADWSVMLQWHSDDRWLWKGLVEGSQKNRAGIYVTYQAWKWDSCPALVSTSATFYSNILTEKESVQWLFKLSLNEQQHHMKWKFALKLTVATE